jgi:hypothetical protein
MYYKSIPHYRNSCFAGIVQNKNLDEIDGLLFSKLVGQCGISIVPYDMELQQVFEWLPTVGYYSDFKLPPRDITKFGTGLTYYPDNEEMLVIYNSNENDVSISLLNTKQLPSNIANWKVWNLYDDLWGTVVNADYQALYNKSIVDSENFESEFIDLYQPTRKNKTLQLKLFPRHPMNTTGMFCPKEHVIELKTYTKDRLDNHGEMIESITSHLYTKEYILDVTLKPNSFLCLDQIITQWKTDHQHINGLKLFPLWYKSEVRKNFNYSI